MTSALVAMSGGEKGFGALKALGPVDLDVLPGERLGLISPNGSD